MDFKSFLLLSVFLTLSGSPDHMITTGQSTTRRPGHRDRNRISEAKASLVLKDAFQEDNTFVVRIRTQLNTTVVTCNGILMEEQLVLTDVTCIKYHGMFNIDASYVQVLAGDPSNETSYKVDQIYLNKADPDDKESELALLRLVKPLKAESQCRNLIRPEKNQSIEFETPVRVIGYTNSFELKENRSRVSKRAGASKFICTSPENINETPGHFLLKGAPLLMMVDCRQYQLIGVLTKSESVSEKKEQDCYVMVSMQIRWYERVKSLTALAAKAGASTQPSVVVVSVED